MNFDNVEHQNYRSLEIIFKEHLDNTMECGHALSQLFLNLDGPDPYIARVKHLEEKGDRLTAEAYGALELVTYSEFIYITEQLVRRLDDIVDGFNKTARLIDICHPKQIDNAANEILLVILSMIGILQDEIAQYPDNALASLRACCKVLKVSEENVDVIYHEWRKKQRRVIVHSLIEENNWTEILGTLEQTTDDAYHTGLLLERVTRYHQKQ